MNTPKQLITHDGQFHADDVVTIALIQTVLGNAPVKRTRTVTNEELEDPDIWVLDQYGKLEWEKHNFDHHHDKTLEATNVLVLNYLLHEKLISEDLAILLRRPFNGISDVDRSGSISFNGFQFNDFIKTFNYVQDGFDIAVAMCKTWLKGIGVLESNKEKSMQIWKNGRVLGLTKLIRVCEEYPVFWISYREQPILVYPDKDIWKVHSADTTRYPIKPTGKETFLHANKFIATYKDKEDAIEAAYATCYDPSTII